MSIEPTQFNLDPVTVRDPQLCHHYTKEIYSYLRTLEMEHRVPPHFMQARSSPLHRRVSFGQLSAPALHTSSRAVSQVAPHARPLRRSQSQRDINATMRRILIDWLVEVAEEYRLESETLFLAVNYIDRFLSHVPVNRSKLQLVGVTCMLVASKYEEIHPPAVDEFVYISDNTYKVHAHRGP